MTLFAIVSGLLVSAVNDMGSAGFYKSVSTMASLGVGQTQPYAVIGGVFLKQNFQASFFSNVFFANMFQVICSLIYFLYSGLLTSLCVSAEWFGFAEHRKALRVSWPMGKQRSSFFLSLPWKYGVPLAAASSILHWLISQSIFVINTDGWNSDGSRNRSLDASRVGYSTFAILLTIIMGAVMVAALVGIGFRRFPATMPLVGSCSAALSAACHRPDEDRDAHVMWVRWGRVDRHGDAVGHCCLTTAWDVAEPIVGMEYQ